MSASHAARVLDLTAPATEPTAERVILAAYDCFAALGIAKSSVEEIARRAGVSRPTVYKYFAGKEAILDEISLRETRAVNAQVRARLVRRRDLAGFLSDVLLLVIRIAASNPYIRRMTESHEFQSRSLRPFSPMFRLQQQWWSGLLDRAAADGELAPDLDREETIAWLTHSQSLLLAYVEDPAVADGDLRRMIARFVVEPMLADPASVRGR